MDDADRQHNVEYVRRMCALVAPHSDYTTEELFEAWQTGEYQFVIRQDPDMALGDALIEFVPYPDTEGGQ